MNKITIIAGGKERVFRFDMYALELMANKEDEERFKGQFGYIARMLYAGLASNCYAKEIANDFTFEDVIDMVDELALTDDGKEKLELISKCLEQSQAFKSLMEKAGMNDEEKKTLTGIESAPLLLVKSA